MLNNVSLVGRLTANPELRSTTNGTNVCRFRIAIDRPPYNGETKTDFINILAWSKSAEFVSKYFFKGSLISITGELHMEKYTDKNGNERTDYVVEAKNARFCGPKSENQGENNAPVKIANDDGFPF